MLYFIYKSLFLKVFIIFLAQQEKFEKTAVKSTIFELQQSFLHIFGVAQNFRFMSQKGDRRLPSGSGPVNVFLLNVENITFERCSMIPQTWLTFLSNQLLRDNFTSRIFRVNQNYHKFRKLSFLAKYSWD